MHAGLRLRPLLSPAAVLPDLADIKSQRRQRSVQLMHDGGSHFVGRPRSLWRRVSDFKPLDQQLPAIVPFRIVQAAGSVFFRCHCVELSVEDARARLRSMAATSCGGENGLRKEIVAPRDFAMPRKS